MIRTATGLLVALSLWGCGLSGQQAGSGGVAGPLASVLPDAGNDPREGGIGGTGISVAGQEGGIGGTGAPRLAATVGTVHKFGSVYINGVRVVFPAGGSVRSPSGSLAESEIDLGETIEIIGELQADGTVLPTDAMFRFPLVGRVDRVDPTGTSLTVLGARVLVEPGARLVGGDSRTARIVAGDYVQVSGLPRGDAIVASRIEKMPNPVRSSVMGRVEKGPRPGVISINGVAVDYGSGVPPQTGWTVRVSGVATDGRLIPYETIRSLLETVTAPVGDISVEGYLETRAAPTGSGIGGFGADFDSGSKVVSLAGERALFIGALEGNTFKARHGLVLPDGFDSRRQRLDVVRNGYAPAGAVGTR